MWEIQAMNFSKSKTGGQEVTLNKRYESEKSLEIMWVNVKVDGKRREKVFKEELKTILQLPTLLQLYSEQVRSRTPNVWWRLNSINALDKYYKN